MIVETMTGVAVYKRKREPMAEKERRQDPVSSSHIGSDLPGQMNQLIPCLPLNFSGIAHPNRSPAYQTPPETDNNQIQSDCANDSYTAANLTAAVWQAGSSLFAFEKLTVIRIHLTIRCSQQIPRTME